MRSVPLPAEAAGEGFQLRIDRSLDGLTRTGVWVDTIAARLALSVSTTYALRLCIEEASANIVMHGIPEPGFDARTIALCVQPENDLLRLSIVDRCAAFDPLQPVSPRPDGAGGQGLNLMRHFSRDMTYERQPGRNRLTMTIVRA